MFSPNRTYQSLSGNYLFAEIARRVRSFQDANPDCADSVISLGIGDVTRPLCKAVTGAMHRAVDDMASSGTFRGYGPEQGYLWLREAIAKCDYNNAVSPDEIFVSDGAKSDLGNLIDIFDIHNRIAVTDPVYPVYVDSNVMRSGVAPDMLRCDAATGFIPVIDRDDIDVLYLCFPNNPTGVSISRQQLQGIVDHALMRGMLIVYDSAYEAYITSADAPHSIYEIEGARRCAIEVRSFSKTAGFTGVRCGYTVVPRELQFSGMSLHDMWLRRQCTKFNGASYISQRAAEAVYTPEGRRQIADTISYYRGNASVMRDTLAGAGLTVYGGIDAPYLWVRTPGGITSWQMFDKLLNGCAVVVTPGVGFGTAGEGYIRLTAFNTRENTIEATRRIVRLIQ